MPENAENKKCCRFDLSFCEKHCLCSMMQWKNSIGWAADRGKDMELLINTDNGLIKETDLWSRNIKNPPRSTCRFALTCSPKKVFADKSKIVALIHDFFYLCEYDPEDEFTLEAKKDLVKYLSSHWNTEDGFESQMKKQCPYYDLWLLEKFEKDGRKSGK